MVFSSNALRVNPILRPYTLAFIIAFINFATWFSVLASSSYDHISHQTSRVNFLKNFNLLSFKITSSHLSESDDSLFINTNTLSSPMLTSHPFNLKAHSLARRAFERRADFFSRYTPALAATEILVPVAITLIVGVLLALSIYYRSRIHSKAIDPESLVNIETDWNSKSQRPSTSSLSSEFNQQSLVTRGDIEEDGGSEKAIYDGEFINSELITYPHLSTNQLKRLSDTMKVKEEGAVWYASRDLVRLKTRPSLGLVKPSTLSLPDTAQDINTRLQPRPTRNLYRPGTAPAISHRTEPLKLISGTKTMHCRFSLRQPSPHDSEDDHSISIRPPSPTYFVNSPCSMATFGNKTTSVHHCEADEFPLIPWMPRRPSDPLSLTLSHRHSSLLHLSSDSLSSSSRNRH